MSRPSFDGAPSPRPGSDPDVDGQAAPAGISRDAEKQGDLSRDAAKQGDLSRGAAERGDLSRDAAEQGNLSRAQRMIRSQLVKFVLVGGFSAIVDFGSTALFTFAFGLSDGVAKALGFVLGTLTAYFINRRWTFQAEPSGRRFAITMATYGLTFVVQWGLYKVSIPWLEGFDLNAFWVRAISFVIAQGTATVLNFLIQKFLIFRR
ncbi:GtrA family protein [Corynebacterium sp. YSMAA1_1_F7]|uniref:GtrA family protein n=1 Tax=Corynebacterium sp. YSMAA1_1_F7 TaxID=3383590 RepID=UPI0038D04B5A